ncbi:hypothetical protein EBQ74_02985 [bacterium]|nr:hypothetical protein [bacterium]
MGLSSLFRIYFGDLKSQEALTYRYDPIFLPRGATQFLLAKPSLTEINEWMRLSKSLQYLKTQYREFGIPALRTDWYLLLTKVFTTSVAR